MAQTGQTVQVRAFESLPVVAHPVEPADQALNLYLPEADFQSGRIGRLDARAAPILLPDAVGGTMPAMPGLLVDPRPARGSNRRAGRPWPHPAGSG